MIIYYKNSLLATLISIFGCVWVITGIAAIAEGEIGGGIAIIALGVVFLVWARSISKNKSFKKWWKQIKDNNLEPQIAASTEMAISIYNKNPQKRTLKKIAELNPAAAGQIEKSLAQKKAAK